MNLYLVAAFTTGVIGGLSWWLYGDDRDQIQKGAGGRPGIASPPLGKTAVLLAQYVAPLLMMCCLLSDSLADGMIPQVLLLRFFHPGVAWLWASACIGLPGFALFVAAKLALNTNYSPLYSSKVPGDLTATGPYQYIRHPIYTGNLALLTAGTTMTGTFPVSCACVSDCLPAGAMSVRLRVVQNMPPLNAACQQNSCYLPVPMCATLHAEAPSRFHVRSAHWQLNVLSCSCCCAGSLWMTCIVALLLMIYTQAALLEERALTKKFCTYYDYTCHTGK